jgi:hypothetical protein
LWADSPTEPRSKFEIWWTFGWEYDLSAFMARIVFSGVLERHPGLRFLIHHGGSMVPHFAGRVGPGWDQLGADHVLFGLDSPFDPEKDPATSGPPSRTSRRSACPRLTRTPSSTGMSPGSLA